MTLILPYILKLSLCLSLVYFLYFIFLRRLTFYNWNRWYLLVFTFISLLLPLVDVSAIYNSIHPERREVIEYIPSIYYFTAIDTEEKSSLILWSYQNAYALIILAGIVFFALRLLIQFVSFFRMIRKARLLISGPVNVYQVDKGIIPFSFANSIFINEDQHEENELKEIIRHEFIHVKQKHSIDIIFSEIICLLNWYNPFAWLIRRSIRQNLEFIADEQVIRQGFDRKQYQYLLLKVFGVPQFSMTSNFNFNSLKKRIIMMNKNKTARVHLVRFLILVPALIILLLAFRKEQTNLPGDSTLVNTDTVPVKHENIQSIDVNKNGTEQLVTIRLKTGEVEKYNLNDEKERRAFEVKYGALPKPPAPPAPVDAPLPPPPPPPPLPKQSDAALYKSFLEKNSSVKKLHWEMDPARVVVTLKNGGTEIFTLDNAEEMKQAFSKYPGLPTVFPVLPPPPPPAPPEAPDAPSGEATFRLRKTGMDSSKAIDASLNGPNNPNLFNGPKLSIKSPNQPLYIVNGEEWPSDTDLNKHLKPELIQEINILKDASAIKVYGEKGRNGVILITTSEKTKKPEPIKKD